MRQLSIQASRKSKQSILCYEISLQPFGSKAGLGYEGGSFKPSTFVSATKKIHSITLKKPTAPKATVDKGEKKVETPRDNSKKLYEAEKKKSLVSAAPSKASTNKSCTHDSRHVHLSIETTRVHPRKGKANETLFPRRVDVYVPDEPDWCWFSDSHFKGKNERTSKANISHQSAPPKASEG